MVRGTITTNTAGMTEANGRGDGPWAGSDGRAQLHIGGNRAARGASLRRL